MSQWLARFQDRSRFRSAFLALLGIVQILYGTALLAAMDHGGLHWWPGSVTTLLGMPLSVWGIIWCAIGLTIILTSWRRDDKWQFFLAAGLNTVWGGLAIQRWWETREPGAWAPAVIYVGIAVAGLMISAWPDPPRGVKGD